MQETLSTTLPPKVTLSNTDQASVEEKYEMKIDFLTKRSGVHIYQYFASGGIVQIRIQLLGSWIDCKLTMMWVQIPAKKETIVNLKWMW